jgi:hypothetical protein
MYLMRWCIDTNIWVRDAGSPRSNSVTERVEPRVTLESQRVVSSLCVTVSPVDTYHSNGVRLRRQVRLTKDMIQRWPQVSEEQSGV